MGDVFRRRMLVMRDAGCSEEVWVHPMFAAKGELVLVTRTGEVMLVTKTIAPTFTRLGGLRVRRGVGAGWRRRRWWEWLLRRPEPTPAGVVALCRGDELLVLGGPA